MTSPRGGSRTVGKRLIGDNAAHDHAAARGRVARRGRALAGLHPRHRPSRRPSPGRQGMTELHPEVADLDPRLVPLSEQTFDLAGVDVVVNTHLHFDHCGGNHLFAGRPIYVQRQELEDARTEDDYTIRQWVEAPGVRYEPVDGELALPPGLRLVPAPGHTPGLQVVVVETGGRPVVVGGRVAGRFRELDEPRTA